MRILSRQKSSWFTCDTAGKGGAYTLPTSLSASSNSADAAMPRINCLPNGIRSAQSNPEIERVIIDENAVRKSFLLAQSLQKGYRKTANGITRARVKIENWESNIAGPIGVVLYER
ncbi:MAG: hypothetical protein M3O09_08120 [Acidobacteriota bacterium]|nr:hypothetical protein [Acidobacteriota bacterium]